MVNILFNRDDNFLATPGTIRKLLDPTSGTGGMFAESQNHLSEQNTAARLYVYGQDYNPRAFAIAASDMLMKEATITAGRITSALVTLHSMTNSPTNPSTTSRRIRRSAWTGRSNNGRSSASTRRAERMVVSRQGCRGSTMALSYSCNT